MTNRARARGVRTAYHEAGHAVAAFELGVPFREVSIAATTDSWGYLLSTPLRLREPDVYTMSPRTRDWLERRIIVGLAGREGNRLLTGRYDHRGAGNDYQQALNLTLHIVDSSEEAEAYLGWLAVRARQIVQAQHRRPLIEALVEALMAEQTIAGPTAFQLMVDAGKAR